MAKDPAVLFYTADFLIGTSDMTDAEVGQYIRLLCYQHQKGHISNDFLSGICGGNAGVKVLAKFLRDENGLLYNERMLFEIKKRSNYSDSQRLKAEKRWNNPNAGAMPGHMPGQCLSSSSSSSIPIASLTIPAPAAFFEKIISLNYQGEPARAMRADFKAMPRLANYDPGKEGIPEAMLYVLESIPAITKKYPKFRIYAFLQKAVNEKFSLMVLAGAMKALIDLQHPPQDLAPYWQALIRKESVLTKCWENEIWPSVKHGKYKLQ